MKPISIRSRPKHAVLDRPRRSALWGGVAAAAFAALAAPAAAAVLTFDDLRSYGAVPAGYGGLDWSASSWIAFADPQDPFSPHSGTWRVATAFGSSDAASTIRLTAPGVFKGAWFSGYGDANVSFSLYQSGALVARSGGLAPSAAPAFLASGYAGLVDAVVVSSPLQGFFAMDDFTFSAAPITPVPEPRTSALLLAGLGVIGLTGRRRRRA